MTETNKNEIKYFSMFSGIGGFELGIERGIKNTEGLFRRTRSAPHIQSKGNRTNSKGNARKSNKDTCWNCVGFSEIDKYAIQIYKKHFPTHKNFGDATKINTDDLPDFDLLTGGFPCQSFSIAGKRMGFKDTRGTLFFEIARIIKAKKPRIVFLENVKGLLSHDEGRTFAVILATLDELGYNAEWQVLNSKNFGVPQNRERVFIIGHLRGECGRQVFPIGKINSGNTKCPQDDSGTSRTVSSRFRKGVGNTESRIIDVLVDVAQGQRIRNIDGLASTLQGFAGGQGAKTGLYAMRGRDNGQQLENSRIRRLTPTECERLQGFPDSWTAYGKVFKEVQLIGKIWEEITVQSKVAGIPSVIENRSYVSNIIKDGGRGGTQTQHTLKNGRIKEGVLLRGAIEVLTAEDGVCDITNLGNDMVMLLKRNGTLEIEELTKKNLISERMGEKSIYPLWRINLGGNLNKEKLFTILTLIKETILSQTFTCVKTGKNITGAIILLNKLGENSLNGDLLSLKVEDTTLISDTQRYKCLGNAVTVNVIEAISERLMCVLKK